MKKWILILFAIVVLLPIDTQATTLAPYSQEEYPSGYVPYYNEIHATALAKLVWAEGRGIKSDTEKSGIIWTVINRVEAGYGNIMQVLTAPNQFAYRANAPVDAQLYELAKDVLVRWDMERCGYEDVGRVLPLGYLWFSGSGGRNWFRDAYRGGQVWDWTLVSPYES